VNQTKPNQYEEHVKHSFDSFCKKVLRNEARDSYDEMERHRRCEISFEELSAQDLLKLSVTDEYFKGDYSFRVQGQDIVVSDAVLAEALCQLSADKREIILLSFFLEMTDKAIGDKLCIVRSTVQYKRKSSLRELKIIMEGKGYE